MKTIVTSFLIMLFVMLSAQASDNETKVVNPGIKLVKIPGGTFLMGSTEMSEYEKPVHSVTVGSFFMGETEVTIQQYCAFLNASRPSEADRKSWILIRSDGNEVYPTEIWYEDGTYRPTKGYENNPANSVSWFGAKAFCDYYQLRLPSEEEWEYAAGGPNHYKYPWGDTWAEEMACYHRKWNNLDDLCPTMAVKSYQPNGYGLYDMAGNADEWCADKFDLYPGANRYSYDEKYMGENTRVSRGGSWHSISVDLYCVHRGWDGLDAYSGRWTLYGFRVAGN